MSVLPGTLLTDSSDIWVIGILDGPRDDDFYDQLLITYSVSEHRFVVRDKPSPHRVRDDNFAWWCMRDIVVQ